MKIEHLDIKVTDATRVAPHEVACRISLVSGETFDLNSAYRNVMKKIIIRSFMLKPAEYQSFI